MMAPGQEMSVQVRIITFTSLYKLYCREVPLFVEGECIITVFMYLLIHFYVLHLQHVAVQDSGQLVHSV